MTPNHDTSMMASLPEPGATVPVEQENDRIVFGARRPAVLVIPLAAITEVGGILCLMNSAPIGWFICAAPAIALAVTGLVMRPSLELTREGLLQRQYPFSTLTRWEVIDRVGICRTGNRVILGYKLVDGAPPPRRQPAAALLRATERPYDGGFFADSLAGRPQDILAIIDRHVKEPELRQALPAAKR